MLPKKGSYHQTIDKGKRGFQLQTGKGSWAPYATHTTTRSRSVSYEFFPHFHPYVPALIQRLVQQGFAALQDTDTLYLPQANSGQGQAPQPFTALQDSTRAILTTNIPAIRTDGSSVSLSSGTPMTLPDGTQVVIAINTMVAKTDGTAIKLNQQVTANLPAKIPVSIGSGLQWDTVVGTIVVPDSTVVSVTLPAGKYAVLIDGSSVSLPASTQVWIRSGPPQPAFYESIFSQSAYAPDAAHVQQPGPVKEIDFTSEGAYSIYNWELFFHAPLLMAVHLSQNQKFQDAQRWFHYIFDPTDNSPGPTPERFWKVRPLQYNDVTLIQEILVNLSTAQNPRLLQETLNSINEWQKNPFQPWAVAKFRPTAYMLKTVMAYLDNLIAWGDSLFQQYTIETINEATQLYIMAANILGPKPMPVPKKGDVKALTYDDLGRMKLDQFGNAMTELEADIPFDMANPAGSTPPNGTQILPSLGQTLYFCVPRNDKLLAYWDTVADRLFKIHNSLNLQGVFQRLPLFDPPIDPALLVRAAASGLDVSAVVSGLNQPLPLVRFQLLVAKAAEICQEVKSLGSNLLAATEKQDNESLSLLRAQHESAILSLAEVVKYSQWQDAIKARQAVEYSLATALQRYAYYQKLLGRTDTQIQNSIPKLDSLDEGSLGKKQFSQADASSEPQMAFDAIQLDPLQSLMSGIVPDGELKTLSVWEGGELVAMTTAQALQLTAAATNALGAVLAVIPQFSGCVQPMGCGANVKFGGDNLSFSTEAIAAGIRAGAEFASFMGNMAGKIGGYARRETDWIFQSNSARSDINQIFKQLRGAQIREAIAKKEYKNHQAQMENAQRIVDFLEGNPVGMFQVKETTTDFYAWMKREVKALYAKAFQLGFEVAKKAERALQHELGDPSLAYIQYDYLDGNEGLMAGEKLLFDIKTMEMAYHDLNQREYEMTKHVSLRQVAPLALVQLRATGSCTFSIPEEALDLDGPGHYFRRIKSLALTVPCVAGPYTSVNCTLTLQKSSIRTNSDPRDGKYRRQGPDDNRFSDYYGTVQSIVTSTAQSDSGLFETNLRDERYLPFEGSGIADSEWQLSLPSDVRQFDFDTITDVILHVRYTAREGGELLKNAAIANLKNLVSKAQTVGSTRVFSIRHDFPSQWAKFQATTIDGQNPTAELSVVLRPELLPFWATGGKAQLLSLQFMAEMDDNTAAVNLYAKGDKSTQPDVLSPNPSLGNLLTGGVQNSVKSPVDAKSGAVTVFADSNNMKNLWVALTWRPA